MNQIFHRKRRFPEKDVHKISNLALPTKSSRIDSKSEYRRRYGVAFKKREDYIRLSSLENAAGIKSSLPNGMSNIEKSRKKMITDPIY